MSWDLFISYASEDKPFVTELARALKDEDLKVWFDESELHVGDNLRQKIEQGLNRSRFALVVLSPQFFGKEWPRRELDGLMAREAGGEDVIFPILHNVSVADVARHSPVLAHRLALYSDRPVRELAQAIRNAIVHQGPPSTVIPVPLDDRTVGVLVDPGDSSEELLTELYVALSSYYRALGGSGLHIKKDERRSLIAEVAR